MLHQAIENEVEEFIIHCKNNVDSRDKTQSKRRNVYKCDFAQIYAESPEY